MEQLLIIKAGADYFRFQGSGHSRCSLQQASVYPLAAAQQVRTLLAGLHDQGLTEAAIHLLTITEEPFAGFRE
ncbi:hypothetical protein [Desulfogranum mediterraneum]|uniref:hypothetical protein n=1 Tax=Desulfogranum mediterraneum TaxID=160661 RepID=UPI00040B6514|nr:hypothetical protein [Desulfogranum mediterraneum]